MINWQFFPKSTEIPAHLLQVIDVFESNSTLIDSNKFNHSSNDVLGILRTDLLKIDYLIEASKKKADTIQVPVLFGRNGKIEMHFKADGLNKATGTVLEVEAGRAVDNYQFLKDLFQACMMYNVNYLIIAVRNIYRKKNDFEKIVSFFETLYASGRLQLPLKGILIVGY